MSNVKSLRFKVEVFFVFPFGLPLKVDTSAGTIEQGEIMFWKPGTKQCWSEVCENWARGICRQWTTAEDGAMRTENSSAVARAKRLPPYPALYESWNISISWAEAKGSADTFVATPASNPGYRIVTPTCSQRFIFKSIDIIQFFFHSSSPTALSGFTGGDRSVAPTMNVLKGHH